MAGPKIPLQLLFGVLFTAGNAWAGADDVAFTVMWKKLDEQKSHGGAQTTTVKEIAYKVTVQNRTFKDLKDVQVKYMIFYDDAKAASTEKPLEVSARGHYAIPLLSGNQSVDFDTDPVKLTTTDLDGGWFYTSGAGNRAKDRMSGVWFRAYANGEVVGEYINPTSISKRQVWKD